MYISSPISTRINLTKCVHVPLSTTRSFVTSSDMYSPKVFKPFVPSCVGADLLDLSPCIWLHGLRVGICSAVPDPKFSLGNCVSVPEYASSSCGTGLFPTVS